MKAGEAKVKAFLAGGVKDINGWKIGSWFSYVASTLEIIGALALGVAGLSIVRDRGLASFGHRAGGTAPSSAPNQSAAVSAP